VEPESGSVLKPVQPERRALMTKDTSLEFNRGATNLTQSALAPIEASLNEQARHIPVMDAARR
jgi:hypothetical protein